MVVDIDGTLTPDVLAILEARKGAAKALQTYVRNGYTIVYLTARSPLAQDMLPDWLQDNGFPDGPLHVAQSSQERKHVADFKAGILSDYKQPEWVLAFAYGDSSTDFTAYKVAGFTPDQVYAIRRRSESDCEPGAYRDDHCLDGWTDHLPEIEKLTAPDN